MDLEALVDPKSACLVDVIRLWESACGLTLKRSVCLRGSDPKKARAAREKKGYRPLVGTANYAFMICLLQVLSSSLDDSEFQEL